MNKSYPVKLWLTTLLLGPLMPAVYELLRASEKEAAGYLHISVLFLLFGLLYSIPTFLLTYCAYKALTKRNHSALVIKILLNLLAISMIVLTFWTIGGSMAITLSLAYSAATIISSLFYRVRYPTSLPVA